MNVKYLFNDNIYVVTNHAVASNPLFENRALCLRFIEKVEFYLSPLCQILHYSFDENQFQIIVKLFDRKAFEAYYIDKKGLKSEEIRSVPESSYIFSQAMANLQSSTAIYFNRSSGRTGALFARRFQKILIKSEEMLNHWVQRMNNMKKVLKYQQQWKFQRNNGAGIISRKVWVKRKRWFSERSAWGFYSGAFSKHRILSTFVRANSLQLQGQFNTLPPLTLALKIPPK